MVGHVPPTKSLITSIYTTNNLVWCLWFHRVGPKKWDFVYAEDYVDRAYIRSYAKLILSMVGHVPPTKSPITSIYTSTMLVWYLWLHRVIPKKWHFAFTKDYGDSALCSPNKIIYNINLNNHHVCLLPSVTKGRTQKRHFAYAKDCGDRARLRSYVE